MTAAQPDLGMRVYRTSKGFRCLATQRTYDPTSAETIALLEQLGSDPLYMKLCRAQQCFRARISPKPWRCAAPAPPNRFPWIDAAREQAYRAWQQRYESISEAYSTCAFVGAFGNARVDPKIEAIVSLHDTHACRGELPLA